MKRDKILNIIVNIMILALFTLLLIGCTVHRPFQSDKGKADYHLIQAVDHYPPYGDSIMVTFVDSFILPADTLLDTLILSEYDTVEIQNESVRTSIIRRLDTFYVESECKTDTIIVEREVKLPPEIKVEYKDTLDWYWWVIITIVGLILLGGLRNLWFKRVNNG